MNFMINKIIEIDNLSFQLKERKIFSNITFNICNKEVIAISGPNGSGKTSLVQMILGFMSYKSGLIKHFSERFYGYVPQDFRPIIHMNITVLEFLKLTEIKNLLLDEVIELMKISKLLTVNIRNLSGGELRKILMAKAILFGKNALFLDEPTCWLDKQSQKDFYSLISTLNQNLDCGIVLISHDPFFQEGFFSKIIRL